MEGTGREEEGKRPADGPFAGFALQTGRTGMVWCGMAIGSRLLRCYEVTTTITTTGAQDATRRDAMQGEARRFAAFCC